MARWTRCDFALVATLEYHIDAIEYVNQFYAKRKGDAKLAGELKQRADDQGVASLLVMCDGEGYLGDPDAAKRFMAFLTGPEASAIFERHKFLPAAAR